MIKYDKIFKMFEDRNMSMYAVRKNKLMNDATIRNLKNGGNFGNNKQIKYQIKFDAFFFFLSYRIAILFL